MVKKGKKQTSDKVSKLASKVLSGRKEPTPKESKSLAGSALVQDETPGYRKKPKTKGASIASPRKKKVAGIKSPMKREVTNTVPPAKPKKKGK